ncbi:MAG: hypothetical protein ACK4JY_11295 [Brevundimonas sp.]|uniref:hypothetical protein n=1 Tax=Brevundimonas sp. TaxID=1871086 RepID=UPI00391AA3AE
MTALYRVGAYKLTELVLVGAICAVLSFFPYPTLCTLEHCGPVETFGGMALGYGFYSLVTGYLFLSGTAFHLTRAMTVPLQGLTMSAFSAGYVLVAVQAGLAGMGEFQWLAASCVGLAALVATMLTRRMTPAFLASFYARG